MRADDVLRVLDDLEAGGLTVWVDGGWGVDALVGRTTRDHADLDLAIDRDELARARFVFEELGFRHDPGVEPGLPARLVLRDAAGRQVDVHPLRFDDNGDGWQQLSDTGDDWGCYPADGLSAWGSIGGRRVRCLTAELQLRFHEGYELTSKDEHDLKLLREMSA